MTGSLSYRNQSIDLFCKSMDWFIYDRDFRHESKSSEIIINFILPISFLHKKTDLMCLE